MEGWRLRAANFFFLIIVFGLQLFNVPCSKGSCSSPVEVIADYLYSNKLASDGVVKALLYPNALLSKAEVVLGENDGFSLPNWKNLLADFKHRPNNEDKDLGLVFVLSCGLCLVGAIISAFGITFLSPAGMLVILWYIYTAGKTDQSIHLLPMFSLAILCSLVGFKSDKLFSAAFKGSTKASSGEKLEEKKQ